MVRGKLISGDRARDARRANEADRAHRRAPASRDALEGRLKDADRRKKVCNMDCGCGALARTLG
jgi:hypothetical protein